MKSKAYEEWYDSFVSAIKHALEPTKKFIRKWEEEYGKLKSEPIKDDARGLLRLKKKS